MFDVLGILFFLFVAIIALFTVVCEIQRTRAIFQYLATAKDIETNNKNEGISNFYQNMRKVRSNRKNLLSLDFFMLLCSPTKNSFDINLAILISTMPCKDHLLFRNKFYQRFQRILVERDISADILRELQ